MHFTYEPQGICARRIDFDIEEGVVKNLCYTGGCDGNHKGLSAIVDGMTPDEVIKRLSGITCGPRDTSCPDQLAEAMKEMLDSLS